MMTTTPDCEKHVKNAKISRFSTIFSGPVAKFIDFLYNICMSMSLFLNNTGLIFKKVFIFLSLFAGKVGLIFKNAFISIYKSMSLFAGKVRLVFKKACISISKFISKTLSLLVDSGRLFFKKAFVSINRSMSLFADRSRLFFKNVYNSLSFFTYNGKLIFRFAVVFFLLTLLIPGFSFKKRELQDSENGIGGGSLNNGDITLSDDLLSDALISDVSLIDASLETISSDIAPPGTAALEPELLSRTRVLFYDAYTVTQGENISTLAIDMGLNQGTIISVNKITNTRLLQIGKVLKIPNQDGILYTVKSGDTLGSIAEKYKAEPQDIIIANELFSDKIRAGTDLFIPGAALDWVSLQEINGDLFIWPVSGVVTSPYGYRRDPFNNNNLRQFHTGLDIRGSAGTPVKAAMSGRVSSTGYDPVFGNYVVINHHSGYRTLYGHLSVIRTKNGAFVGMGEHIGDVGSTGLSTGPHLHFMVYKNGVTVNPRPLMK